MENYKLRKLLAEAAYELGSETDRREFGKSHNHNRLATSLLDAECELRKEAEAAQTGPKKPAQPLRCITRLELSPRMPAMPGLPGLHPPDHGAHFSCYDGGNATLASWPLFLIREAEDGGCSFEDLADGYGEGEGTHGDWSGIRDSSPKAKLAMLERALNFIRAALHKGRP